MLSHPRLSFVHGDICDEELVRDVVEQVDVIVNAAAESHVEKSIEEGGREFVATNVDGTRILLDAIREHPVERFILISSSEVYGTAESDPMDEEHPLNPRSPYAATKAGADRLAYSYWIDLRPPDRDRAAVQQLRAAPAPGEGRAALHHVRRSWTSRSRSTAPATRAATGSSSTTTPRRSRRSSPRRSTPSPGEVFNIATGTDISVDEIADAVLAALGKPDDLKIYVDERPGQVDRHIGSTDKAERVLGWHARTSFEQGLERTVAWYRENEAWWRAARPAPAGAYSS